MRAAKILHIVSAHAEGEVGDVIVGGVAPPPGATLWGQDTKVHFMPLSRERMGNSSGENRRFVSQGSERIRGQRRGEVPSVVAGERDVLPAERGDVAD